jgi:Family of unknown function (DUF5995)
MTVAGGDERVVRQIDEVIAWSLAHRSRVGYFAALYWHVATTLMRAVQAGRFTDPARIEQLNGVFFGRYLAALDGFRRGEPTTQAWGVAFSATERDDLLIVQHLLLGANAHIDLDLAIGVTETVPPDELPGFRPDFMRINGLLGSLIDGVCRDVTRAWPLLRLISHVARREDDWLLGFGLREARFSAWEKAERLAAATPAERPAMIARMDADAAAIGQQIASRAPLPKALVWIAALGQQRDVDVVIGDLLT